MLMRTHCYKEQDMACEVRRGSNPDFCPPVEEGITLSFEDEEGSVVEMEFLGLVIDKSHTFGFFFPTDEDDPAFRDGQTLVLEVTKFDDEGNPSEFELVDDEQTALSAFDKFREVTKDIYTFE